jgi:hypothetical protein
MNKNAKTLLEGNLRTMFQQTGQWMEDLSTYEEELHLFNSLISNKINTTTTDDLEHREIYRNIDSLLYKLSEDLLEELKAHKKVLSQLIENSDLTENHKENKTHLHLLEKMRSIKHGVKKLKKALFAYLKDHPFEFDFDTLFKEL